MQCVLIALQVVRSPPFPSSPFPLFLIPRPSFLPPLTPFSPPSLAPFPSPLPPPEIISECQEWDEMIKQLKFAPTAHIFFMYLGFYEKHWSKAL